MISVYVDTGFQSIKPTVMFVLFLHRFYKKKGYILIHGTGNSHLVSYIT